MREGNSVCMLRRSGSNHYRRGAARSAIATDFVLVCILAFASPLMAQEKQAGKTEQGIVLNLDIAVGKPGDVIDVPVTLSAPETSPVAAVVLEISFPKKLLSFGKADQGPAAETSDSSVRTKVRDNSNDADLSILELTVSGKNAIKPGILAYLKFTIAENAAKGSVPLKIASANATSDIGAPVEVSKGKNGDVQVFEKNEEIPVVGCFFFTH